MSSTLTAKLFFLCLQLFFELLELLPRLGYWVLGRSEKELEAHASPQLWQQFGLSATSGAKYEGRNYSGHTSTILCAFRPQQPVPYTREVARGGDGNPMCLDWHPSTSINASSAKSLLVIFPGLASWSGTNYIERFVNHANAQGHHCVVFNARGLGNTPLKTPRLMSAVWTEDIRVIVRDGPLSRDAINSRFGGPTTVIGVGFSLGGVIVGKFAGEECRSGRPPFDAVLIVNSPLDTIASNTRMMSRFHRLVYQPSMTGGLLQHVRAHTHILGDIPNLPSTVHEAFANGRVDDVLGKIRTVEDFDRYITCPANQFHSPAEYYQHIAPMRWVKELTIPTLCISARDDPVCVVPFSEFRDIMEQKPNVGIVMTPYGGHLGFVQSPLAEWQQRPNLMETLTCQLCSNFVATHQFRSPNRTP